MYKAYNKLVCQLSPHVLTAKKTPLAARDHILSMGYHARRQMIVGPVKASATKVLVLSLCDGWEFDNTDGVSSNISHTPTA
jgi:hypothetical protein